MHLPFPRAFSSSAAFATTSIFREAMYTRAPLETSAAAIILPMPVPPPWRSRVSRIRSSGRETLTVTSATRPRTSNSCGMAARGQVGIKGKQRRGLPRCSMDPGIVSALRCRVD